MYKNNRILALIPARGGSKGIKNKNITLLQGKPLISYTINAAIEANCFDSITVSTDSQKIADISKSLGASVPFLRSEELANDTAKSEAVIFHALDEFKKQGKVFDIVVYLQPTSPLRTSEDICNCLDFFIDNNIKSLTSLSEVEEHPLFMRTINNENKVSKVLNTASNIRRQDLAPYYILNGAIYINRTKDITQKTVLNDNEYGYILPQNHCIDIDTQEDLKRVADILKCTFFN